MNDSGNTSVGNPYEPGAALAVAERRAPSPIAVGLRRFRWLAWMLPLAALAFWAACYHFSSQIMFVIFEIPNWTNPGYDKFMFAVLKVSTGIWIAGSAIQVAMLAWRKDIPKGGRHLAAGCVLSAACVTGVLWSRTETTTVIREYGEGRRMSVEQWEQIRQRQEDSTSSPSPAPAPAPTAAQ